MEMEKRQKTMKEVFGDLERAKEKAQSAFVEAINAALKQFNAHVVSFNDKQNYAEIIVNYD